MTIETTAMLLGGFMLLVLGAELLVRGASRLAGALGISPLVIGLTVVAYGTSAPELSVSLQAALAGNADIAVANVVGSNIFNVLFILGACAAIKPLVVSRQLVRLEVPIMLGVSVLLLALSLDGRLGSHTGRGLDPIWRAPGGRTTPNALAAAKACGYRHVGWSPAGFLGEPV